MKKKLIASIFSLVMAFVLMTSSSFAWFTVSTSAAVNSVEATMSATNNLEIAKATTDSAEPPEVSVNDGTDETKWGATVTSLSGATLNFPATLDSGALKTIGYNSTGRTAGATVTSTTGTMTNGVGAITATVPYGDGSTAAGVSKNIGAYYGVWLRTNLAGNVTCTVDTASLVAKHGTGQNATDVEWNKKGTSGTYTTAEAVKVAVMVGNTVYASGESFSLTANTPTLVKIIVYVDGDACIAKSVSSDINISGLKVSFAKAAA